MSEKNNKKFICHNCNYSTDKKYDWNKHLLTQKHKNNLNCLSTTTQEIVNNDLINNENKNMCICGSIFSNRHNLSRHKKSCSFLNSNNNENLIIKISELEKQISNNNVTNNITNNIVIM